MNTELFWVLVLLAGCVGLFVAGKPRMDVIALLVIVILPLTGIVGMNEALAGFSDPNVILIAVLFVIGEGLVRTGVAYRLGDLLMARAGKSQPRLLVLLMLVVAGLGSVMSSTGVVAIFIPVVLDISHRLKIPARRLMMPLSFAGLMSGMQTLVATPPNMVVDSALRHSGHSGFGFFSFTPIGLVILAMGIGYMLLTRQWLDAPGPGKGPQEKSPRRNFNDYIRDYRLDHRAFRAKVRPESPLVGKSLESLELRNRFAASLIAIERRHRFAHAILHPQGSTTLQTDDVLFVDIPAADETAVARRMAELKLDPMPLRGRYFSDQSREVGMAEISLPPTSSLLDKSVLDAEFRSNHRLQVIGLRRGLIPLEEGYLEENLRIGDTLLVTGPWKAIRKLQSQSHDFIVLGLPTEIDQVAPAAAKAPHAVGCLALMVLLMVTGAVPNVIAALAACLLMGLFRCVDMESAYRSIHWPSLILIVGMMPFSSALEKTGGIALAADGLLHLLREAGPRAILGGVFALTAILGMFISNTATAVLMAPVALKVAGDLGVSPYPFAMVVAVAASAAFMTPVSSSVNTLVLGPGQYRFVDFVKVGVPFSVLVMLVSVLLIPLWFPW